eukprot:m.1037006 g.1037006  ORF g.1037006 m.1037006 type:complete len:172 (+) comp24141_c0_seq5:190-705(+)
MNTAMGPASYLQVHVIADSEEYGKIVRVQRSGGVEDVSQIKEWLASAAGMLAAEWPRGGSAEKYEETVLVNDDGVQHDGYALPCSYLHIVNDSCVGHARLTECFEGFGGSAAAATYVIVQKNSRGKKLGTKLMTLLETEARRLGYCIFLSLVAGGLIQRIDNNHIVAQRYL